MEPSKEISNTVLWACAGNRSLGFIFLFPSLYLGIAGSGYIMLSLNNCVICSCFLYTSIPSAVCASKIQKDEVY